MTCTEDSHIQQWDLFCNGAALIEEACVDFELTEEVACSFCGEVLGVFGQVSL